MGRKNYGPGGFSDQYDNDRLRGLDNRLHPGGNGAPIDDEYDFNTRDYFPPHGEAFPGTSRKEPERDLDLRPGPFVSPELDNFARSELRPDLHPEIEQQIKGRGPDGWKRTDERLYEEVCSALSHSLEVDATELEVKVEEACVYLKGMLATKGMRRVAEDLVGSVPGVVDVFTLIKVRQ